MSVKNEFAHVERCLEPLSFSEYPEGHYACERGVAIRFMQSGPDEIIEQLKLAKAEIDLLAEHAEANGQPLNRTPFPRVRIGSDPMTPLEALAMMFSPLKYDAGKAAEAFKEATHAAERAADRARQAEIVVGQQNIENVFFLNPLFTPLFLIPKAGASVKDRRSYAELSKEAVTAREHAKAAAQIAKRAETLKNEIIAPLRRMVEAMVEVEPASVTQGVLGMFEEKGLKELADTALEARAKHDKRADEHIADLERCAGGKNGKADQWVAVEPVAVLA